MSDKQLDNKTALLTGSTAGIGYAIAKHLLEGGARVYVNGRSQERVDSAMEKLRGEVEGGMVKGVAADFSKVDEIENIFKVIPAVDILINNVGVFEVKDFVDIPDEDWLRFFEINVLSGVRLSRHYFPQMIKKNWGRIIFISSESAINIPQEMVHYGMTKTAQLAVARGLAEFTKGTGVTVNSVLPGPTASEGLEDFMADMSKKDNISEADLEKQFFTHGRPTSLLQRFITPDEIASMVAYLSSPLASAVNGAALRVDGGVVKSTF